MNEITNQPVADVEQQLPDVSAWIIPGLLHSGAEGENSAVPLLLRLNT